MKHRDNTCIEVENSLALFVGGDLEDVALAEIARHLDGCAACAERAARASESRELLVSALKLSQRKGPELWPLVRTALADQGLLETRPATPLTDVQRAPKRRRILPYFATAAAAVLVGFWLGGDAFEAHAPVLPAPGRPAVSPEIALTTPAPQEPSAPVVLVSNPGALRLVGRGESRLREGADIYLPDAPWIGAPSALDPHVGAPVGLRQLPGRQ